MLSTSAYGNMAKQPHPLTRLRANNCSLASSHCSKAVEYLTLKCWPHYLPREFTVVFIVKVYVPSSANTNEALEELHDHICELQNKHPGAFFVVVGDFTHAKLTDTLPLNWRTMTQPSVVTSVNALKTSQSPGRSPSVPTRNPG